MPETKPASGAACRSEVVVVAATSRAALEERLRSVDTYLKAAPAASLRDIAFTLNRDIASLPCRLGIVASSTDDLAKKIDHALKGLADKACRRIKDKSGIYFFEEPLGPRGKLAFLFPGEGSQYPDMLSGLCIAFPEARACFDRVDRAFVGHERGYLPSEFIFPKRPGDAERLWQMDGAVEAVFTANAALAAVLDRLSIRPDVVAGHSTGDYSALQASGCLDVPDDDTFIRFMLDLNALYSRLEKNGTVPHALLVAVGSPEPGAARRFGTGTGSISVAMDNCPHQYVLAGDDEALGPVVDDLRRSGSVCDPLPFGRAYHTPAFLPVCALLAEFYGRLPMSLPRVEVYSCATAAPLPRDLTGIRAVAVEQWALPVRFQETIENLYADGVRLFVEVGPRGNLTNFVDDILRGRPHAAVPADVRHRPSLEQLHHLLALLAAHGIGMDLGRLYEERACRPLSFDRPSEAGQDAGRRAARRVLLATGCPPMRLSEETAQVLRTYLKPPAEVAAAPRAPQPSVAAAEISPVAAPARDGFAARALSAHMKTMEQFLSVQEQVMRAVLAGHAGPALERAPETALTAPAAGTSDTARPAPAIGLPQPVVFTASPAPPAVRPVPVAAAPVPAPPAAAAAGSTVPVGREAIAATLLDLVSDRTGYPREMLDLKLNLEADLGIDSIKRVEILGTFQQRTNLLGPGDMEALGQRKTLAEVIDFIVSRGPAVEAPPVAAVAAVTRDRSAIADTLLRLVSDRTGYPRDMLDLKLNLEADLGIDSIKRVEILGTFQQQTNLLGPGDMEALGQRKTLAEVIDFLVSPRPEGPVQPVAAPAQHARPAASKAPAPSNGGTPHGLPQMPFIDTVLSLRPGEELVALRTITVDQDLFLRDHTLGRQISVTEPDLTALPVMPLTMSMEMLAEAASILAPGLVLVGMKDVRGHRWIVLQDGAVTLRCVARRVPGNVRHEVQVQIFEETAFAQGAAQARPLVEGAMVFGTSYAEPPAAPALALKGERPSRWASDSLYREGMFHGPAFQGVVSMDRWGEDGAEATLVALPADGLFRGRDGRSLVTDPVLLDQPGQVVGLWTAECLETGFVVFPFHLEALHLYGPRPEPGTKLRCLARILLPGDGQVRSDLDVVTADGHVWARFVAWEDRRFDVPAPLHRSIQSPGDAEFTIPVVLGAVSSVPDDPRVCCRLDLAALPRRLFEGHGGLWRGVLAHLVLSRRERAVFGALEPAGQIDWLLIRVVAKDAARRFLVEKFGLRVPPADVEIVETDHGRLRAAGAWAQSTGEPIPVSVAAYGGSLFAAAGETHGGAAGASGFLPQAEGASVSSMSGPGSES
jgi:malonyl CoA-acyl carrier protein transacylase/acyl carrier protein